MPPTTTDNQKDFLNSKKRPEGVRAFFLSGSPGRIRTADQVVNSHPLYRLSYRGILIDNLFFVIPG
jgi:hypothetical protein